MSAGRSVRSVRRCPLRSVGGQSLAQQPTQLPTPRTEAKFQFSFRLKAWDSIFGDNGTLWFACTQQSGWQVYNSQESAPFRSTDFEPEAILSFHTYAELFG
ncbi:MAG TPA: phospholipase A [Steroidobacteraceae bacterium]|nr:phospholipase A [Steroidobacteraceae bacterium]